MRVAWDSAPDRPFTDSRACGDRTISRSTGPNRRQAIAVRTSGSL